MGRAVFVRLAAKHAVRGFDRAPSSAVSVLGDLTDAAAVERAAEGAEAIVHVGGLHAPRVGAASDAEFERVNVGGTRIILDVARRKSIRRFVYTSTTALCGTASTPASAAGWVTEELTPQPRTIYHSTKLAAEALVAQAAAESALCATILRMSRCFPEPAPLMAAYRLHRGVDARPNWCGSSRRGAGCCPRPSTASTPRSRQSASSAGGRASASPKS